MAGLDEVFAKEKKVKNGKKGKAAKGKEREPVGQRGVTGTNLFQILRESYSTAKGLTVAQGVEIIRKATEGTKARNGSKYPEALMVGRIRKFLAGARMNKVLEVVSGEGESTKYRYTGEVTVTRGRAKSTKAEKKANKAKKVKKADKAA